MFSKFRSWRHKNETALRAVFWNRTSRGFNWSINSGPNILKSCLLHWIWPKGGKKIQLESSGTIGLCLGIVRHPCDNPHALSVGQPSAAESCKKIGRWRQESDVSRSARSRHFIGSNRRAPKKNNSRSSNVSGQGESASRRTYKWRSRHPSRQGYFRQRCFHGPVMARQAKSSSLDIKLANKDDESM